MSAANGFEFNVWVWIFWGLAAVAAFVTYLLNRPDTPKSVSIAPKIESTPVPKVNAFENFRSEPEVDGELGVYSANVYFASGDMAVRKVRAEITFLTVDKQFEILHIPKGEWLAAPRKSEIDFEPNDKQMLFLMVKDPQKSICVASRKEFDCFSNTDFRIRIRLLSGNDTQTFLFALKIDQQGRLALLKENHT